MAKIKIIMSIKRTIQLLLAKWFATPDIPNGKTTGFSFIRSEKSDCQFGKNAYAVAPFLLQHVQIGDRSYFARNAHASHLTIGKFTSIGPNFCCGLGIHPTNGISTSPYFYRGRVDEYRQTTVGNDVFIGANVTVLDGVTIGDGAVIGAGAVVTRDIPPYAVAVGVPAKVMRYRFDDATIMKLLASQWWNGNEEDLKRVQELEFDVEKFAYVTKK